MRSEVTPSIIVPGRWLDLARGVWIVLAAVTLGVYVVGASMLYKRLATVCTGEDCAQWRLSPEEASVLREAGVSVEAYAAAGIALSAFSA